MINAVNEQFSRFVSFAQDRVDAGKETAIAKKGDVQAGGGTTLEERGIKVTDKSDWVGKSLFRKQDTKTANNEVRDLFRKCVADMFGGESNIPDSVKEAMLLKDYGKGKPLTARRILAVRDAINSLGRDNIFGPATDPDGELANKAFKAGFTRLDFGKLNTAANLLSKAKNIPVADAFDQVITRGSAANRAMNAGPLYMKDVDSFRQGVEAHEDIAARDVNNLEIARENGSQDQTKNLSTIADNLACKFRNFAADAKKLLATTKLPADTLDGLIKAGGDLADKLAQVSSDLTNGTLTDRTKIYERLFDAKTLQHITSTKLKLLKALGGAATSDPAVADFLKYVVDLIENAVAECNKLGNVYSNAVAKDVIPVAKELLIAAAHQGGISTGRPCSIPQMIMDTLDEYIEKNPFANFAYVQQFCKNLEKYGDANLRFSDAQKADLKSLVEKHFGAGPKAEKMFQKLVDHFEASFFAVLLIKPRDYGKDKIPAPDLVINHFKAHPEAIEVLEAGFKVDTDDDVAKLKGAVKDKVLAGFNGRLAQSSDDPEKIQNMTSLATGLMPQGVREYNVGYVTFNGAPIPNAQLGTKFPQLGPESNSPERRGYAEFLETKFDANHKKMRQLVSYTCGMAEGLGGMIDKMLETGDGKVGLKGPPLREIIDKGTYLSPSGRNKNENYNIQIDENGDVKITLTHHVQRQYSTIMGEGAVFSPALLTSPSAPLAGGAKMIVTMTIKNASDAELGDKMPEFTIDDIRQEEI